MGMRSVQSIHHGPNVGLIVKSLKSCYRLCESEDLLIPLRWCSRP